MIAPEGLGQRGARLWSEITQDHDLDPTQSAILLEACRMCDRLDGLDEAASKDPAGSAARHARLTASDMARLLVALRLPDAAGRRPQRRSLRGVRTATGPSSLERARAIRARIREAEAPAK